MASTGTTIGTTNSAAKAATAERTAQVVNSTAQLMRQLRESSHSEVVAQLPKELLGKVPSIKNTGKNETELLIKCPRVEKAYSAEIQHGDQQLLYQMPAVVLALDSHMDNALNGASHLGKLKKLLMTNDES